MRALLAEDDRMIGEAVAVALKEASYAVDWVRDGEAACTALDSHAYDIVLLDLGLPEEGRPCCSSGGPVERERCGGSRDNGPGRDRRPDPGVLYNGADDYVVKPFDMGELLARMRAVVLGEREAHQARSFPTDGFRSTPRPVRPLATGSALA